MGLPRSARHLLHQALDKVRRLRHPVGAAGTARPRDFRAPSHRCGLNTQTIKNNAWRRAMLGVRLLSSCAKNESTFSKRRNENGSNTNSADEDGNIYYFNGALNFSKCACSGRWTFTGGGRIKGSAGLSPVCVLESWAKSD